MAPKKLLALGHSHLSSMVRAYREWEKLEPDYPIKAVFDVLGRPELQPNFETIGAGKLKAAKEAGEAEHAAFLARLRMPGGQDLSGGVKVRALSVKMEAHLRKVLAAEAPDAILLSCMGNEYNSIGMLRHPVPFDVDMPGSGIGVEEGVQRIPRAVMKAQIRERAEQNVLLFWRFFDAEAGDIPVYLVPPPPPIASEEHIRAYPGAFADRVEEYGISPVGLRRKLWLLYCEVLREALAGTGTVFVELPPVVFDEGSLARQFWQKDPTHGNAEYGLAILDRVFDLAFARETES